MLQVRDSKDSSYKDIVLITVIITILSGPEVSESWVYTLCKLILVAIGVWLSTKIKNTIFTRVWDWLCDIVYYHRCQNLDRAKSLAIKEETLEEQLTKLRASGYMYPELSQEVDHLTENNKPTRKGFPDIPFSLFSLGRKLCLYVKQCYTSKADKLKLDTCHKEIDECLGKLEKQITLQNKADEQIHHPSSDIGFAISPSRDNIPYQITDFNVIPDHGSLIIQWSDRQNDGFNIIRYEIDYNGYLKEVKPPFTKYVALTDRRVTPWMSYTVKIRAITENGLAPGPWSESITVVNGTKPSVPSGLRIVRPTSNTSVKISCRCLKHEEIVSCVVSGIRCDEFEVPFTERNGDRGVVELTGLNPNERYGISLKFKNIYGMSEGYSTMLEVSISDFIPSPPENLTGYRASKPGLEGSMAKYKFNWSTPSCSIGTADPLCYEVEMTENIQNQVSWNKITTVPTTTYKLVTDKCNTCYYRVRAVSANSCKSDYSQVVMFKGVSPVSSTQVIEGFINLIVVATVIDTRSLWLLSTIMCTKAIWANNYSLATVFGLSLIQYPLGIYYYYGALTSTNKILILATILSLVMSFCEKTSTKIHTLDIFVGSWAVVIGILENRFYWLVIALYNNLHVMVALKKGYNIFSFTVMLELIVALLAIGTYYVYGVLTVTNFEILYIVTLQIWAVVKTIVLKN